MDLWNDSMKRLINLIYDLPVICNTLTWRNFCTLLLSPVKCVFFKTVCIAFAVILQGSAKNANTCDECNNAEFV